MSPETLTPAEKNHTSAPRVSRRYQSQRQRSVTRARGDNELKRELLISVGEFETRVALMEDERLVEMSVERPETERMVGDIYKGRVQKVLPGMQSAFVDIGWEKAAFLHASDMGYVPDHDLIEQNDVADESALEIVRKRRRTPIEEALKEGQEVLVQVIKEPMGAKGPRITTDVSIPGRYVVLVPDSAGVRVSKKINNWGESRRLRKVVEPLRPEGFGVICRTESLGKDTRDFEPDIKRSLKIWTRLLRKSESAAAPALIHKEEEMTLSIVRDMLSENVDVILVDDRKEFRRMASYIRQVSPHLKGRLQLYKDREPLFDKFGLEREIEKMLERQVWIKKGSYLVIDHTEAMITIDVNTGRFVGSKDQEDTIFKTNLEAAREIARQLRLRDMGGLIVCDFIDMYSRENRRKLFDFFRRELDKDKAKKAINPVSEFGLIELTRQRVRPSLVQTYSEPCTCCNGIGRVLSKETMSAKVDRWFIRATRAGDYKNFHLVVNPALADSLVGEAGDPNRLKRLMKLRGVNVNLVRDTTMSQQLFTVYDANTNKDITELYAV